jgi:hypothetical protein
MNETVQAIADEIDDRSDSLEDVDRSKSAGSMTYSRAGRLFAAADPDGFEFLVGDFIAGAALRTPDVTQSSRGDGWVRFAPSVLDEPAVDRAVAWFEAAWRRAES